MRSNDPNPETVFNRAFASHRQRRIAEAKRLYEAVLSSAPDHFNALLWLSRLEADRGRQSAALRLLNRALKCAPRSSEALAERGSVLVDLKRLEEALTSYEMALIYDPQNAMTLNNRGVVLAALGRLDEALASYDCALSVERDYAQAFFNRGNVLWELRRPTEALQSYDRGLAIKPDHAEALYNRGNVLLALKRDEAALASFRLALAARPDYCDAWNNASIALLNLHRPAEAVKALNRLLVVSPDRDYAKGDLLFAALQACDWSHYDKSIRDIERGIAVGDRVALPFKHLMMSRSPERQLRCAQIYARDRYPLPAPLWRGERYCHDRIRMAYLSADFSDHATMYLMADLLDRHDRTRFDLTAVSFGSVTGGTMRSRVSGSFDRFLEVSANDDREVANMLRELEIDITIDLKGYTLESRPGICAFRPAPIQVNYLGYPGTMGTASIDYIIADRFVIPDREKSFYTEQIVYLPHYQPVNDLSRYLDLDTPSRKDMGLSSDSFVFCCFNNNFKICPDVFSVWMRVLHQVENAVLWLLEDNTTASQNLRHEAKRHGIDSRRLIFAPRQGVRAHLARQRLADVFLDTFNYNGHTTARDALSVGLPVVTCLGATFASRVAASLLDAAGLPDLIAGSPEAYEHLAIGLATDQNALEAVRRALGKNRSSHAFFDVEGYRRLIETAYTTMWQIYQRGEGPRSFAVAPE